MTTKKSESKAAKPKCEPTSQKQSGIVRYRARDSANPMPRVRPRVRLTENADSTTSTTALVGTLSPEAFLNLVGPEIPISDARFESIVRVLRNTKPRDQIEAMLQMQMADMHKAAMMYAHRLAEAESIAEAEIWERGLNRLARTFVAQWEAYNRYRSGREQKATAPHVSVSQAIVANVTPAPREIAPNETAASPPPLADSPTPPITISDEPAPAPAQLKRK